MVSIRRFTVGFWLVVVVSPSATAQINLSLSPGSAATFATAAATTSVQVGYARATVNSGGTPYATAIFSLTQNGIVVSEAGVPPSVATTFARLFIEYRNGFSAGSSDSVGSAAAISVNTGFAAVNSSNRPAQIDLRLRDSSGNFLTQGRLSLAQNAHLAKFIDQLAPDFVLPSNFSAIGFGSLELQSDQPISILALRLVANQRGETLLTTTPVADLTQTPLADSLYFPQVVDGGGYQTTLILLNTSSSVETGMIRVFDDSRAPLSLRLLGTSTTSSTIAYTIPPSGSFTVVTDGASSTIKTGSLQVTPNQGSFAPAGAGIFSFIPSGILVSESGIPSAVLTTHARLYIDKSGGHNTGVALADPTGTARTISFTAYRNDGTTQVGNGNVNLGANGHLAKLADELVPGLPAGFTGVLAITSSRPFAALTLRSLINSRGDFLLATFPIADQLRSAPLPLTFAQIVDGGGYKTEFILLSAAEASTVSVSTFAEDGSPLPRLFNLAPRIDSVDPLYGPIRGGTVVAVRGANFQGISVSMDKVVITLQALSANEIRFTTPPHDNGFASIRITSAAGIAYGEFLYIPPRLKDLPPGYITTVAGVGNFTGFYRRATQAVIQPGGSPAFDQEGNLYVPEWNLNRVSRVRPDGIIEPFAGSGFVADRKASQGDGGPATEASLTFPRGVTTDSRGYVYITDHNNRIRRVDTRTGIITTIAGDGTAGFSGDGGPAARARLNSPTHITGDGKGTIFFIDFDEVSRVARIRKITPDGTISTVAGRAPAGFSGDGGPATEAQFNLIFNDLGSLALDPQGNLYVADSGNYRIRRIDGRTGIITTVFGHIDAPMPRTVATDAAGNIYFERSGSQVMKMSPTGEILATYGIQNLPGFSEDGTPITDALLAEIRGLAIDAAGSIVYTDDAVSRVRRLNLTKGVLETLAGTGPRILGETGPAIATILGNSNGDLAFLPSGELLIGDAGYQALRKIDADGNISTFARGGVPALLENRSAQVFATALAVKTDAEGNVYLSDAMNVYRIDTKGAVHLTVGRRKVCGYSGDGGPALNAELCQPLDMVFDTAGNLFIADTNNNRIRRVDAQSGMITTVAGSGPVNGYENYGRGSFCGDGGPATQACLNTPQGVALDSVGNLFIADSYNDRIRKVDSSGTISTFATGRQTKLVFDTVGYLYAIVSGTLLRYDPAGAVTRIVGDSSKREGFSGDGGPALQAQMKADLQAEGIAIDGEGNIFFNDGSNGRIRAVRFGAVLPPPNPQIQASIGTPQSTSAQTSFASPFETLVLDSSGRPAPGVRVEFSAPASGPSCTFLNGANFIAVITNRSGRAPVVCTANLQQGSYNVTAAVISSTATVRFALTNTP